MCTTEKVLDLFRFNDSSWWYPEQAGKCPTFRTDVDSPDRIYATETTLLNSSLLEAKFQTYKKEPRVPY